MANKNMNFSVDLLPSSNNTYYLGSSDKKWNLYVNQINGASPVTGVKGNAETNYRTGQVNLTAANIGAIAKNEIGNTQQLIRPVTLNGVNDLTIQSLINDVRANRLAFLPPDQIIIEKTTDGGTTWVDGGFTDAQKANLFSEKRETITLPLLNGKHDVKCGIRITITAMKYNVPNNTSETQKYNYWNSTYVKSCERYCQLKNMYFWVTGQSNGISIKVERATGENSTNWYVCLSPDPTTYNMTGWSGNNFISLSQGVFGGSVTQTGNYWNYRITLMTVPKVNNTLQEFTSAQAVYEIRGYGDTWWTKSNEYMASDHLYTWDYNKNVTFPANINAPFFIGSGALLTNLNASNLSSGTVPITLIQDASTSQKGVVQLSSATNSTSTSLAATASAVKAAYDLANGKVSKSGDTMTGTLNITPASGEGGELHLNAATNEVTKNSIILDNYYGEFRIFGGASADGTTKTGPGTPLVIDPYNKTITGGYTITGNLTGNVSGTAANITGTIAVDHGGTGSTTAEGARTNLGLGSMATETATNYLKLSGGTLTGALTTANNTWNTIGDDAYFGDINKAGHIGIKGKNGNTGLFFVTYNQSSNTTGGAITWDGTKFSITSTTAIDASISGNAATATKATYLAGTVESAPALTTNPGTGLIRYSYNVNKDTTGLFNNLDNANSILTLSRHSGDYCSQLGFSSDNKVYYRNFSAAALNNTKAWEQIAFISSTVADAKHASHASAAHYSTLNSSNNSGIIKVKIKKKMRWMLAFTLRVYQAYCYVDYVISGYNYNSSHWFLPKVYLLSNSDYTKKTVTFGYDNDADSNNYCTLWVSIPRDQYTGADIFNVTNGFEQIEDLSDTFEIIYEAESTGTVQTTVEAYRPLLYNEKASSATTADSATAFSSNKNIELLGDVTGLASSTGGWAITTSIGTGKVTNAMLAGSITRDKLETNVVKSFSRTNIGTSPNFDDPGINGFFEVRSSSETTGETGTKPFNGYGGLLSLKTADNTAMLQIAGVNDYWYIRGKQSANVTLADVAWQRLVTNSGTWSINISGSAATANSVAWANVSGKPLTFTAATTGFTISGGTTSKTLTVSDSVVLKTGSFAYLAYYSANGTISGHSLAHFSDTYSSSTANGKNELVLGNNTASTSNGSAYGQVALYSSGTAGTYLKSADNSTSWYTATLQAKSGTIAYTSDLVDTKNTAGSTNSTSKLFLVGPTSQAASAQTYSNQYVYTTNGALAAGSLQLNANTATIEATIGYNTTTECITFSFN